MQQLVELTMNDLGGLLDIAEEVTEGALNNLVRKLEEQERTIRGLRARNAELMRRAHTWHVIRRNAQHHVVRAGVEPTHTNTPEIAYKPIWHIKLRGDIAEYIKDNLPGNWSLSIKSVHGESFYDVNNASHECEGSLRIGGNDAELLQVCNIGSCRRLHRKCLLSPENWQDQVVGWIESMIDSRLLFRTERPNPQTRTTQHSPAASKSHSA